MDIILELLDTFVLDHVYAALLPLRPAPYDFPDAAATNATAAGQQAFSAWHYKPATAFMRLEPSAAAYASSWPRDHFPRQAISLFFMTWFFGLLTYFLFATLSYYLVFDHRTLRHPKFLKNQVRLEIAQANKSMPLMALLTAALFLIEVRGHGKLYDTTDQGPGRWYDYAQFPCFLLFTDGLIYFIHRGLHHPAIYKHFHKAHHKWIMPTPFASHAFHPLDGFAQGLPYHLYPLLFPLQKLAYVALFIFINFWTIMIHDGEYMANNPLVNGSACHTAHHLYFNYNYGQFFTLWDRIGGSYRKPDPEWFDRDKKMSQETWKSGISRMEKIQREVEGEDDRTYEGDAAKKTQ